MAYSLMAPTVSIITALYRSGAYLPALIASVQAQTLTDWELILVDDASPDTTYSVAEEFVKADKRIRLYRHEKNAGAPAAARNTGISHAQGKWVTFLDHDDTFMPDKLEKLLNGAELEKVEFICSNIELVNASTGNVEGLAWGNTSGDVKAGFRKRLLEGNFVPPNSTLIKRSVFERVGVFDTTLKGVDDYDLWYRIACVFQCSILNEPLATWHYKNSASISADSEKMLTDEMCFFQKVKASADEAWEKELADEGEKRTLFRLANLALLKGDYRQAAAGYRKAGAMRYATLTKIVGPIFKVAYSLKRRRAERKAFAPLDLTFTP